MVHQESIVQYMDLNTKEVKEEAITNMFGKYISKAKTVDNILEVEFDSDKNVVKITDWKGWSDLRVFLRQPNITNWIKLTIKHGTSIIATRDTLIMVYDTATTSRGFHGETKYAYNVISFEQVKIGDTVRVRHTQDDEGFDIDFDTIDKVESLITEPKIGYEITTRSGFYNCNDFYLYGRFSLNQSDEDFIKELKSLVASSLEVPKELIDASEPYSFAVKLYDPLRKYRKTGD